MLKKFLQLRQSGLAVFNRKDVANILGLSYPSTNPALDRLVRAGVLTRLRRDRYVLAEDAAGETRKIANDLVRPSAISLWTALCDAGLTTQVPRTIQSATPKRPAQIEREGLPAFQYVHLPAALFFDVAPDPEGVLRVSPEKALLDLLFTQRGTLDWGSIDGPALDRKKVLRLAASYPPFVRCALDSSPVFQ